MLVAVLIFVVLIIVCFATVPPPKAQKRIGV